MALFCYHTIDLHLHDKRLLFLTLLHYSIYRNWFMPTCHIGKQHKILLQYILQKLHCFKKIIIIVAVTNQLPIN